MKKYCSLLVMCPQMLDGVLFVVRTGLLQLPHHTGLALDHPLTGPLVQAQLFLARKSVTLHQCILTMKIH